MSRAPRVDVVGYCDHLINHASTRSRMFPKAVEQLDAGNVDQVHGELRMVTERTNMTKDGQAFADQMRAATERLTSP